MLLHKVNVWRKGETGKSDTFNFASWSDARDFKLHIRANRPDLDCASDDNAKVIWENADKAIDALAVLIPQR